MSAKWIAFIEMYNIMVFIATPTVYYSTPSERITDAIKIIVVLYSQCLCEMSCLEIEPLRKWKQHNKEILKIWEALG